MLREEVRISIVSELSSITDINVKFMPVTKENIIHEKFPLLVIFYDEDKLITDYVNTSKTNGIIQSTLAFKIQLIAETVEQLEQFAEEMEKIFFLRQNLAHRGLDFAILNEGEKPLFATSTTIYQTYEREYFNQPIEGEPTTVLNVV